MKQKLVKLTLTALVSSALLVGCGNDMEEPADTDTEMESSEQPATGDLSDDEDDSD